MIHAAPFGAQGIESMSIFRNCLVAFAVLAAFTLYAQTDRANLTGAVTDQTGAIVPGLIVKVAPNRSWPARVNCG